MMTLYQRALGNNPTSGKKIVCQSTFSPEQKSNDADLVHLKGERLLVADKLKKI